MKHRPFVLLTALVFTMVACTDSDDDATTAPQAPTSEVATTAPTTVATTTVPDATVSVTSEVQQSRLGAFSFADTDLCKWLTPDKISELVEAEYKWVGTATETGRGDLPGGCVWELSGTPEIEGLNTVSIGSAPAPEGPILEYSDLDDGFADFGVGVRGHPALSDGVIYVVGGFGYVAFGVPEFGYVQVNPWVPGDEGTEDARFALADGVIQALGWTS